MYPWPDLWLRAYWLDHRISLSLTGALEMGNGLREHVDDR